MKKILSIVLLFVFLISLCSCETNPNELPKETEEQATTTLDRKKPMGYASDTYYDFIYVVFEKGHRIPDRHKEIIEKYGIQYGFE